MRKQLSESIYTTGLLGLYYVERQKFDDERGFFQEVAVIPELEKILGYEFRVAQVNHSQSKTGVVRGMHAEGWNKLVRVVSGVAFCALADIRPESESFGQVETFKLGFGEGAQPGALFIEKGLANSICAIEGPVEYVYLVDRLYQDRDKNSDRAISIFDPDLAIEWPVEKDKIIISGRDRESVTLRELFPEKFK